MDTSDLHCTCPLCDGTAVHIVLPEGDGTAVHYTSTGVHHLPLED